MYKGEFPKTYCVSHLNFVYECPNILCKLVISRSFICLTVSYLTHFIYFLNFEAQTNKFRLLYFHSCHAVCMYLGSVGSFHAFLA